MPSATENSVTFITLEQYLEMKENGKPYTVVDVLDEEAYKEGHIPEAINIPSEKIEAEAPNTLPKKEQPLIVYCANYMCHASTDATRKLQEMGYKHVYDYKAGKKGWTAAGLPLAKG